MNDSSDTTYNTKSHFVCINHWCQGYWHLQSVLSVRLSFCFWDTSWIGMVNYSLSACKSRDLGLRKCERRAIVTFLWKLTESHKTRRDITHMLRTVSWQTEDLARWRMLLKFRKMWSFLSLGNPGLHGSINLPFYGNYSAKSESLEEFFSQGKGKAVGHLFYLERWCSLKVSSRKNWHFQIYCVKDNGESRQMANDAES